MHQVKYEFTSDKADQYRFSYAVTSNDEATETINGTTWSKSVSMPAEEGVGNPTIAAVTVYPPATWVNTPTSAKIKLAIYVDGQLATSTETTLSGNHFNTGIKELASF
ncbi:hypothetical protein TH63_05265 [Rufibacter radiotolerans]|uniref:Uncharacterized protein n=1 Tax=Rufibacter radiotolerans TaxID=1379910 RepID=A0A0H4VN56_9BACT|nr:hypothetical protein [Rufibacter radiotolerans]AKQ45174.1 hypothetical protein TH63_05265 [Rufibacter radiotolerans]